MSFSRCIKQLTGARDDVADVNESDMHDLFAAMLDGGVPDLELGAMLTALSAMPTALSSVFGGYRAISERVEHVCMPEARHRALVFASYNESRTTPNLLPWLALALRRLGIPVLVHGSLGGAAEAASAYVFRELGIMPSATIARMKSALERQYLAFVPAGVLCPGLANVLALRNRLGLPNGALTLAALLDPFAGDGVCIFGVADSRLREVFEKLCCKEALDALIFESADNDAFVDPHRRPCLAAIRDGKRMALFESENGALGRRMILPQPGDVVGTAAWTRAALAGDVPVPHPLINQLACCLFVSGYAADVSQAKAIAAVRSGAFVSDSARMRDPDCIEGDAQSPARTRLKVPQFITRRENQ